MAGFVALLLVDVLVVVGAGLERGGVLTLGPGWDPDADGGWLELLGAAQMLAAAVLLGVVARRERGAGGLVGWVVALVVMVVDDLTAGHEQAARLIEAALPDPVLGAPAEDVAGTSVWFLLALVVGACVVVGHVRSGPDARVVSWLLAGVLGCLALLVVVVDMGGDAIVGVAGPGAVLPLAVVEATVETLAATAMLLVAALAVRDGAGGMRRSARRLRRTPYAHAS